MPLPKDLEKAAETKKNERAASRGSLTLFLELLELLLCVLASRSRLLRELFCLGLLHLVQLHQLFLTRWHTITSLSPFADSILAFFLLKISLYLCTSL